MSWNENISFRRKKIVSHDWSVALFSTSTKRATEEAANGENLWLRWYIYEEPTFNIFE